MTIPTPSSARPIAAAGPAFRLGIVTGLRLEAEIAVTAHAGGPAAVVPDSAAVACAGPGSVRAAQAAAGLVANGARALLSFGLIGGCDPALPPGTVILATGVRDLSPGADAEIRWTNLDWRRRLRSSLLGTVLLEEAAIGTTDGPVFRAAEKQTLFWSDGVAAVDMESAAIARAATAADIPFMAVRVVVDSAEMSLPRAALAGISPGGEIRGGPVLRAALLRPRDLPALVGLSRAHRRAVDALARAAAAAGPLFRAV